MYTPFPSVVHIRVSYTNTTISDAESDSGKNLLLAEGGNESESDFLRFAGIGIGNGINILNCNQNGNGIRYIQMESELELESDLRDFLGI